MTEPKPMSTRENAIMIGLGAILSPLPEKDRRFIASEILKVEASARAEGRREGLEEAAKIVCSLCSVVGEAYDGDAGQIVQAAHWDGFGYYHKIGDREFRCDAAAIRKAGK